MTHTVLFLPGASGAGTFWEHVRQRLPRDWTTCLVDWPGLGNVPGTSSGFEDLVQRALDEVPDGTQFDVVAQSMGGIVAMRLALEYPARVGRMVLAATSG